MNPPRPETVENLGGKRTLLVAFHDCGGIVAASISDWSWPENNDHVADFRARQAGRVIQEWNRKPDWDEWCVCFRRDPDE